MRKKTIYINKHQFIAEIMESIPSNTIIKKNITGIGATTLEILALRNSLIVLPNLPVIYIKEKAHLDSGILGVHADISVLDIIEYLSNTNIEHKKILTTPESFYKVLTAFESQKIDYKKDYFFLFDECDKISKDIDFRKTISLPMDSFFAFKSKAFISATALVPEDPRFEQQDFEFINIVPNFEVKQDVKLYKTNSTLDAFGYLIGQDRSDKNYFVFCNSLNIITHLINANNLKDQSSVFCSETSAERFKRSKFNHVDHKLNEAKFSKFNFFTSRFYSALDIYFDKDVEIYIISDLGVAEHTIIDPATDAIQIIGRFRNRDITKNVKILFTEDNDLHSLDKEACLSLIEKYKFSYDEILKIGETLGEGEYKSFINELQNRFGYNYFLKRNNTLDYFKIDNFIQKNKINKLYQNFDNLVACYKSLVIEGTDKYFYNVKYVGQSMSDIPSSSQTLFSTVGQKFKTTIREVVTLLDNLEPTEKFEISNYDKLKQKLKSLYPDIVNGYDLLDRATLSLIEKPRELEREIKRAINALVLSNFDFLNDLKVEFLIGEKLSTLEIVSRFNSLISKYGLKMKPTLKQLESFIDFKRCQLLDQSWGYRVNGYINK